MTPTNQEKVLQTFSSFNLMEFPCIIFCPLARALAKSLGITKEQQVWGIRPRPIKGEKHVENLIELMDEGRPFHKVPDPRI